MTHFNLPGLKEQLEEYQADMASPGFRDNLEHAQSVNQKAHAAESKIENYNKLVSAADDLDVLIEMYEESGDKDLLAEIQAEFAKMHDELETIRLTTLLRGEYDALQLRALAARGRGRHGSPGLDADALPHVHPLLRSAHGFTVQRAGLCWRATRRASRSVTVRGHGR